MERDYIYSVVCELADKSGLSPRDYIDNYYAEQTYEDYGELPDAAQAEIDEARKLKSYAREEEKTKEKTELMNEDINRFKELFPNISPDEIPESVWDEVGNGVRLTEAFAVYTVGKNLKAEQADAVNIENQAKSTPSAPEAQAESFYSEKQVAGMSPSEIKRNYKSILNSLKSWRL